MPRPCKRRRICEMPQNRRFLPSDTAQGNARRKLAECLIEGKELYVDGGDYVLCEGDNRGCGCGHCRRQQNVKGGKYDENSSNV